jgi:acetyl esterase
MPVDPGYQALLAQMAAANLPKLSEIPVPQGRAFFSQMIGKVDEPRVTRTDRKIPGPASEIPIRVYRPVSATGVLPLVVNYHGGGWVIGDLDTGDSACVEMCLRANAVVVSVDYRLAPEHRFPAAVDDSYAATLWAVRNAASLGADPERVAVAGDSAGGNLAAVVAMLLRDRGGPRLRFQLLIYPVADANFNTPSYQQNASGYMLEKSTMEWFWDQYAPNVADRKNSLASPILASNLSNLPPALVMTAEFDPLRDEGEAYAEKLRKAGVKCETYRGAGLIHGFFSDARTVPASVPAIEKGCAALRDALA